MDSIQASKIEDRVTIEKFVPHAEAITRMKQAAVLFLIVNKSPNAAGILTGKVFEYLGSGRPIVCIGPSAGDMKRLLADIPTAHYIDYDDTAMMVNTIVKLHSEFGNGQQKEISKEVIKYSRKNLASEYHKLIVNLSSSNKSDDN